MKRIVLLILLSYFMLQVQAQETCDTAIPIDPGFYTAETLTGSGASNICFGTGATNAAWYSITPQISGFMTVSSCLGGTDTRLSVYDGTCDSLNCIANNDDFCEMTPGGSNFASQVIVNVDSGSIYYIEWDDRWTADGFDFSVMISDCLDLVTNINAISSPTGAEITWTGNSAGTYIIEYGESGFIQGDGTIITGNLGDQPVIIEDLTPETGYDYYLTEICEEGDSTSAYFNSFITLPLPPVCGGTFLDLGGIENPYNPNEFTITTICPDTDGDVVTVNFTLFDINQFGDSLEIFNGSTIDAPSLGIYTGQENIGAFESTDSTGCLTFLFTSNGFTQNAGWEAGVTCAPPSTCPFPYQLVASEITSEGATISWTASGDETMWLYEVVAAGTEPTGIGTSIDVNPYTITGLDADTQYDVYISADCGDNNTSIWIGPATFTTQPAPPECGGLFTDSGGINGPYSNNENVTYVICPDSVGDVVTLIFTFFDIENGWEFMDIYDGPDINSPLLMNLTGTQTLDPITSTDESGCLTVVFTSDGVIAHDGWIASVVCGPPPTCPAPSNIAFTNITSDGADISWLENGDATSWIVEIVPSGTLPTGDGVTVSTNPYTATGLEADSQYDVYVTADCVVDGLSFPIGPMTFVTSPLPPECGGQFSDSGGAFGNYSNDENTITTICPDTIGNVVTVVFTDFQIENFYDTLYIYNGSDINAPLLMELTGPNSDIPPITSSSESGCLTFLFTSDGSVTYAGWTANIICGPPPTCPTPSDFSIDNITFEGADLSWTENGDATSWEIEIVPMGDAPSGNGLIVTDNPYTYTGLNAETAYDIYFNSWCSDTDESFVLGPFSFNTAPVPPECGGLFVDTGGENGFYGSNENYVTTICPDTAGNVVSVAFTAFDIAAFGDTLFVFNGPDVNSPPLGAYNGFISPGTFTSAHESGCLTFVFTSGAFGQANGWSAEVTCGPAPDCYVPIQLNITNTTVNGATINWLETGNSTEWFIEIVPAGDTPTGVGTAITTNPYIATGLLPETTYDVYVSSNCDGTASEWIQNTFTTNPLPPENDFCYTATPLTVNMECLLTTGNTFGATASGIQPGCAFYNGGEVWYSFVAPSGGEVTIETFSNGGMGDSGLALYEGPCNTPTLLACNDDGGQGLFSLINSTTLTPGETYYAVVWAYGNFNQGSFDICVTAPDAGCDTYLGDANEAFNTTFGGAPVSDVLGFCPFNQLEDEEVTASELFTVDGFVQGTTYTFSMCDGPGAGSWSPEIAILDDQMNIISIVQDCSITWEATYSGTYFIGINEVGFCGDESQNTEVGNGYPALTCQGEEVCTEFLGGPWTNFNGEFGGAPQADPVTGICPVNTITAFEVFASEIYTIDNFVEGETYTFSICDGPNAGSWDPELLLLDENMVPLLVVQGCSLSWTATYDGTYFIGINEVGFCGSQSSNTQVGNGNPSLTCLGDPIGVEEVENTFEFAIYPNPADNKITITLGSTLENKSLVKIISLQGKIVLEEEISTIGSQSNSIDVSHLSNGIYFLEVINGQAVATKKIAIE